MERMIVHSGGSWWYDSQATARELCNMYVGPLHGSDLIPPSFRCSTCQKRGVCIALSCFHAARLKKRRHHPSICTSPCGRDQLWCTTRQTCLISARSNLELMLAMPHSQASIYPVGMLLSVMPPLMATVLLVCFSAQKRKVMANTIQMTCQQWKEMLLLGPCYCHRIYGHQSPEDLGYLKVLKKTCTKEKEEEEEREKARAQHVVVVRADASPEEKDQAEKLARENWEKAGKVATWGCQWFHIWKQRVTEAVEKGQSLIVVFFPGQVGEGKETFLGLSDAELWNGIGLGGSQKGEVAFLDWMKEKEGPHWNYTHMDVALFLKKEFKKGAEVDAFDGKQWHRGTLLSRPETISSKPEQAEWLKWEVLLTNGETLMTDRVRHTADGTIQKLCETVSADKFLQMVRRTLPDRMTVGDCEPVVLPNRTGSLAVRIQIKNIEDMQHLRNLVLSSNFEVDFNHHLRRDHGSVQIRVDKTFFCKHYEEKLFSLADLTKHQEAKLQEVKLHKNVHIRAVAGAGKTFIAVQHMLETLQRHALGTVLFIAPCPELCLFVIRWLVRKLSLAGLLGRLEELMGRFNVMYKPYESLMSVGVDNGRLVFTPLRNTSVAMFLLAVVDEAHDIYRPDVDHAFLEKVQARQYLLLSSLSRLPASISHSHRCRK